MKLSSTLLLSALALTTSAAFATSEPIIGLITKTETTPFFVKMKKGAKTVDELPADAQLKGINPLLTPKLRKIMLPGQSAEPVGHFDFYQRASAAYAIVVTGEKPSFGNFVLRKGVIGENLRP
jgi:hypothetical protein